MNNKVLDIKKERETRGMTQDEFADLLGVSRKTITNYESGGNIPETKEKIFTKILSNNTHIGKYGSELETQKIICELKTLNDIGDFVAENFNEVRKASRLFDLTVENESQEYLIKKLTQHGVKFQK